MERLLAIFRDTVWSDDGSRIIVGAVFSDGNGINAGHARVYVWKEDEWRQVGDDLDGEAAGDLPGYSVAMSGDGSDISIYYTT